MTRYIDVDAVIEVQMYDEEKEDFYTEKMTVEDFICRYSEMPSIIVPESVRHGKWITEECLPGVAVCSICGHEIRGIGCQYTKYCDECGARMRGEE